MVYHVGLLSDKTLVLISEWWNLTRKRRWRLFWSWGRRRDQLRGWWRAMQSSPALTQNPVTRSQSLNNLYFWSFNVRFII